GGPCHAKQPRLTHGSLCQSEFYGHFFYRNLHMNEAEDLTDLAWSTPEELQHSIIEMLRRRYGDIELSPEAVQAEIRAHFERGLCPKPTQSIARKFPEFDGPADLSR